MCTYVIELFHPSVQYWKSFVREPLMSQVRITLTCVSVDVVRRGKSHVVEDCPPSVLIAVEPQSLNEYIRDAVDKMWKLCNLHGFEVNVEAIEGKLSRYSDVQYGLLRVPPTIGKSVGIFENPWISGTPGKYVKISKEGFADKICALTCHHVVAGDNRRKLILLFFDVFADWNSERSNTKRVEI